MTAWRDPVLWALAALFALLMLVHVAAAEPCWRAWLVAVLAVSTGPEDVLEFEIEVTWTPGRVAIESVRLVGIETRAASAAATAYATRWLAESGATELIVCRPARDPRRRLWGRLVSATKGDLGAALLAAGHAGPDTP